MSLGFRDSSVALLWAASCFAVSTLAHGAEVRSGDTVHIKADEVIEDDLYAFGEYVTVEGTVKGDLIAFARQIIIKGTVEGDLAAAGQAVLVEGRIDDDARLAGQVLKLTASSEVGGDLLAAGLSAELERGATVGGDVKVAGYQADLSGNIGGNVNGGLANCRLAGSIGGDVLLEVGGDKGSPPAQTFVGGFPPPVAMPTVPAGLTVASTAKLDGKLVYSASREAVIEEGADLANEADFSQKTKQSKAPPTARERALVQLRHLVSIGLLGLAMVILLPRWSTAMADTLRRRPLLSLVGGVAGIIAFVVLLIVLVAGAIVLAILFGAVTLDEMSGVVVVLGLLGSIGLVGGFWLFTSYLALSVVGLAIGRMLTSAMGSPRAIVPFLIGFVLLALLISIPYAGGVIGWLVMLAGLGALGLWQFSPAPVVPSYPPPKPAV